MKKIVPQAWLWPQFGWFLGSLLLLLPLLVGCTGSAPAAAKRLSLAGVGGNQPLRLAPVISAPLPRPTALPPVPGKKVPSFSGTWKTEWGTLTCLPRNQRMNCTSDYKNGTLEAKVSQDGLALEGTWAEAPSFKAPKDSGRTIFLLAADGNSFRGHFWYGEAGEGGQWNGTRSTPAVNNNPNPPAPDKPQPQPGTLKPPTTLKPPKIYVSGFAGTWDTDWGVMTCTADGVFINCDYTHDQGTIEAAITEDGWSMDGTWSEAPSYEGPDDAGVVTFALSEDGTTINGFYWYGQNKYGGTWTGTRQTVSVYDYIQKVTMAKDNAGQQPTTTFKPTETVNAVVSVANVPNGTIFTAQWFLIKNGETQLVTSYDQTLAVGGKKSFYFALKPNPKMAAGNYLLVITSGEDDLWKESFEVR